MEDKERSRLFETIDKTGQIMEEGFDGTYASIGSWIETLALKVPKQLKGKQIIEIMKDNNIDCTNRMLTYYVEEGLLPKPEKPAINQSLYNKDHVFLFVVIDILKKYMSLEEIKKFINMAQRIPENSSQEILNDILFTQAIYEKPMAMIIEEGINKPIDKNDDGDNNTEHEKLYLSALIILGIGSTMINYLHGIFKEYKEFPEE